MSEQNEMTMIANQHEHEHEHGQENESNGSADTASGDSQAAPATGHKHGPSYANDKAKILSRLRRIEGQVRGVERMVENDQYCVDVLTQMSSIISALRATGLLVLEDHIRGCVVGADKDDQEAVLDELTGAIERFVRSVG